MQPVPKNPTQSAHPLVDHPIFTQDLDFWNNFSSALVHKNYARGEMLAHHGDVADKIWIILSGWVKLVRQTPDGRETIIGLCTTDDIFGEASLFQHGHYPYYAEMLSAGRCVSIPSSVLRELVDTRPLAAKKIMQILNERIQQAQLKLEHINTLSAAQRLACFVLRLCRGHSESPHTIHLPIDKYILASFLGMKPETLSRSFQQLKDQEIEVHGDRLLVKNVAKLRDFVCNHCSESGMCDA